MRHFAGVLILSLGLIVGIVFYAGDLPGVDDAVQERFAPGAAEPLVDAKRGDLPVLFALLAGTAGGFVAGYCFRGLFPPSKQGNQKTDV